MPYFVTINRSHAHNTHDKNKDGRRHPHPSDLK